jgi:hypothetical protein
MNTASRSYQKAVFSLVILLALAVVLAMPQSAQARPITSLNMEIVPGVSVATQPIIGMNPNTSRYVGYGFTETAGGSGYFNSFTYRFFMQDDTPLGNINGPINLNYSISIQPNGINSFSYPIYLPASVANEARAAGQYAIVLKTSFDGNSTGGTPIAAEASTLVVLSPAPFSKVSPTNGASNQRTSPTLHWNASLGSYSFEYCVDSIDNDRCDTEWTGTYDPSGPVTGLWPSTTYYWQVRAFNYIGEKTTANTGAWWHFTIMSNPSPALIYPPNKTAIHTNLPTLTWETIHGATGYTIQVSKTNTFSSTLINSTVTGSSYPVTKAFRPKTVLFWRVRTNMPSGVSAWSDVYSFATANPPSVPALKKPVKNELTTSLRPVFEWRNSKLPAGTILRGYQIQVSTSNTFNTTVIDMGAAAPYITISNYMPTFNLVPATIYYWRVRSYNTAGDYSAWAQVRMFRTP